MGCHLASDTHRPPCRLADLAAAHDRQQGAGMGAGRNHWHVTKHTDSRHTGRLHALQPRPNPDSNVLRAYPDYHLTVPQS